MEDKYPLQVYVPLSENERAEHGGHYFLVCGIKVMVV